VRQALKGKRWLVDNARPEFSGRIAELAPVWDVGQLTYRLLFAKEQAMAIYLKYTGIDGEVTEESHKRWIEINSLEFGAARTIPMQPGSANVGEASLPTLSEITLTRLADSASPMLFQAALGGGGKEASMELTQTQTGDKKPHVYMTIKLEDAYVSAYRILSKGDWSKGERPTETVSLSYKTIDYSYQGLSAPGMVESTLKKGTKYDIAAAKTV
jgi:type VI secretion system secreted protein Hcp